jgi:hypothetical protein
MRQINIYLLTIICATLLISCGEPWPPDITEDIKVVFDSISFGDCCSIRYWFSISDSLGTPSSWYWPAMIKQNEAEITLAGEGQRPPIWSDDIYLEINYIHEIEPEIYYFYVFRCENKEDIGVMENAEGMGIVPEWHSINPSFGSDCYTECCTGDKYYVTAKKDSVDNVVGARANIRARLGKLCGHGINTGYAVSASYISIQAKGVEYYEYFAQTGCRLFRESGQTTSQFGLYFEISGPDLYKVYDTLIDGRPFDGDTATYQVELDPDTGTWTATFSGHNWKITTDTYWVSHLGQSVQWTGEIRGWETDMPGTENDKCVMKDCQYKEIGNSNYYDAGFDIYYDHIGSDDLEQWEIDVFSDTRIRFWDVNPQP